MIKRFIRHIKRWNKWRKHCGNGRLYKISVLFGNPSPTFGLVLTDEEEEEMRKEIQEKYEAVDLLGGTMTEEEAKKIILDDPEGNIIKRIEAIAVARSVLGEDCTMKDIWRWAEGNVGNQTEAE